MKTTYIWFAIVCQILLTNMVSAQKSRQAMLDEIAHPVTVKGWIDFKADNDLNPLTLLTERMELFGLTASDEMRQVNLQSDELGFTHFKFQQYHKGIKIVGAENILHHNGSYLKSMNGYIAGDLDMAIVPGLPESESHIKAKEACKAELFVWEHPEIAEALSKSSHGQKDFEKPVGELVFCRIDWNGEFTAENLVLAYVYKMVVLPMYESKEVYVNAHSGEIIIEMPLATNCISNSGNTSWYGSQNFKAEWFGWPNSAYFLESICTGQPHIRSRRGDPIIPYNYGNATTSWVDADGANGYNQRAGVTTYWGLIKAYEYYKTQHNRNSYNNSNGTLDAYSEITGGLWLSSAENASWNSVTHHMSFGAGGTNGPLDDWNSLHVVGHEMTHGVVQFTAGLSYSGESGALNESFADIFGEMIQFFATGVPPNYLVEGSGMNAIRSLWNPNAVSDPDTYLGSMWWPASNSGDNYGVHTNSGVQNHWFFLLSEGATGTNDHGQDYSVSGLGNTKAAKIAYRNLLWYLTSSSGYIDAREGSIRAAEDLYGTCSNEALQTANAWHAVGVALYATGWDVTAPCTSIGGHRKAIGNYTTSGTCNTTILINQVSSFSASQSVTLKPGFTAPYVSNFTAFIEPCNMTIYNLRDQTVTNSEHHDLDVESQKVEVVTVFPNPAMEYLVVEYKSKSAVEEIQFSFVDLTGRSIAIIPEDKFELENMKKVKISVSHLNPGFYTISLKDKTGSANAKFVKM